MFIAAFFIITKTWHQPRCPSVGEWINSLHPDNKILLKAKQNDQTRKDREKI